MEFAWVPEAEFLHSGVNPGAKAFLDADTGEWFTRAQLFSRVTAFANSLQFPAKALGFHFAFNDGDSLIAYLAAIEAGHAVVMLNPELDGGLKSRLIALFRPDFIIAPISHPPGGIRPDGPEYSIATSSHASQLLLRSREPQQVPIHPDLTLLLSTSGSTGSPKLVRLSRRNLESNAWQINQALGITERDRSMVTAPIFNGYGQSVVHTHLLSGGSFVLTRERMFSRKFWDFVSDAECNSIGGTPYFYQLLDRLDLDSPAAARLTKFVQTGGRLPEHLVRKFHYAAAKRSGALHLMYGQAEATARITGLPPEFLPAAARSVGRTLPGGRLWVEVDGARRRPMEEGELIYEGPNVMMGYATHPADLEQGDLLGGKLATGDLGYQDDQGLFYITGRKTRFVKLFGWRISLDDVEELLAPMGPVAAVNEQDRIVVYTEDNSVALAEAVQRLSGKLRLHPSGFEVRTIQSIPRLGNGKIDYRSLIMQPDSTYSVGRSGACPTSTGPGRR
jgi:acyl-CoA synthetase (AMP-forming)/AMP-acid ligase II